LPPTDGHPISRAGKGDATVAALFDMPIGVLSADQNFTVAVSCAARGTGQ
jgi:hypothetical protein